MTPLDQPNRGWAAARLPTEVVHLDSAAAGRQSRDVLETVAAHARREAEIGAYVAWGEAAEVLDGLRAHTGELLGVPADGVAFVESATAALAALLRSWPFPDEAVIGVLPVEWGPNLEMFAGRGLDLITLPAEPDGLLDLDAFGRLLRDAPPAVVHLTHVTSHRGLVQPVTEAAALCRTAGVALWVDSAQAIGHVDTVVDADALYATSRKWLAGPRGVGMIAVADTYRESLRVLRPAKEGDGLPAVRYLESDDAHIAGRVGLAAAVREHRQFGVVQVRAALDDIGRLTRDVLGDVPGWEIVSAREPRGAITALRPTSGQDVFEVRKRLLDEHRIVITAGATWRAPGDMREPLLRISPHLDATPESLQLLRSALSGG